MTIFGGSIIVVALFITLTTCVVKGCGFKLNCCKKKEATEEDAEALIYTSDRNSLIREAETIA